MLIIMLFAIKMTYGLPLDRLASFELCTANICAPSVPFKEFTRLVDIAVYLPAARAFTVFCLMLNEAADILRRITEKQADFVRKFSALPDPSSEFCNTAFRRFRGIAQLLQYAYSAGALQILYKARRTAYIDQCPIFF